MLSKNNRKYQCYKQEDKKQRFGLRKLSIGVASVLLGTTFALMGGASVYAATPTNPGEQAVVLQQSAANEDRQMAQNDNSATSSVPAASGSAAVEQPTTKSNPSSEVKNDSNTNTTKPVTKNTGVASPAGTEISQASAAKTDSSAATTKLHNEATDKKAEVSSNAASTGATADQPVKSTDSSAAKSSSASVSDKKSAASPAAKSVEKENSDQTTAAKSTKDKAAQPAQENETKASAVPAPQKQPASSGDANDEQTMEAKIKYTIETREYFYLGGENHDEYFKFKLTYDADTGTWKVPDNLNEQYQDAMKDVIKKYEDQGYESGVSNGEIQDLSLNTTSFSNADIKKNKGDLTSYASQLQTLYFTDRHIVLVSPEEKKAHYANDNNYVAVSADRPITTADIVPGTTIHYKRVIKQSDYMLDCTRTINFYDWNGRLIKTDKQVSRYSRQDRVTYDLVTGDCDGLDSELVGRNSWPEYTLPDNCYLAHDPQYLYSSVSKDSHVQFQTFDVNNPAERNQTVNVYVGQPEKITFKYINAYTGEKLTPLWYGAPADTTAELDPSWHGQKLADYIGKGDVEDNQPSVAERPAYPINGYKLINYDDVASQPIEPGQKTYTFEYAPLSPIVIKYVDEDNNQTIYTTTIDNVANGALPSQHYTTKQLEFPGYRFDHSLGNINGIVGQHQGKDNTNPITVTYYYKETDKNVARYSREADRSDERHDPFYPDFPGEHDIDTAIDYTTANQDYQDFLKNNGYTDVGGENTEDGIYTGQENHINYCYVKDQPVVINFLKAVMKNGQVIDTTTSVQDSQTIEAGKGGWTANASSIAGCQFDHVELGAQSADGTGASGTNHATVSGQFAVVPQQVNFYYLPQVAYNVHYRDVTTEVAGGQTTGFTPNEGSNLDYGHEVIGISGSVGDAPDNTSKLWNYRAAGYALAEGPADLGKATLSENMGDVNDRTGDQYVYLVRTPTKHTEQRSASRTIHYVGVDNDYADVTASTVVVVAPSWKQEVNLTGTYYTDANMLLVNTKEVTLNGQQVTIIDPTNTNLASETWEIDSAKGVKKDGDDYVFAQIKVPAAFAKWEHYANLDQNNSPCPVDPNSPLWQGTLSDVYLAYRQKGQYVVHYRDVTDVDKTTFTPSDGTALHDTKAISGWINDAPDGRDQLWNKYGDDGYVMVQSDDFLAQQTIKANTPDQYVYLMKVATPRTEDKVIKRIIHYVAKTVDGQNLKADQVQQVTLTGTYYVDSKGNRVHASELKDAQGNVQKDTAGHIIYVVSNGTPQEIWAIKDDPANHDVTVNAENAQKFDFTKAENDEAPATITAKDGGTWHYFDQKDNATCAFDPAKNNEQQVTLTPVYLIYKQMGSYNIHYVDVTGSDKTSGYTPSDGVEKTAWLISNIGSGKYAGDPTDASADLTNRASLFQNDYVIVESSPKLGQQTVEPNMKDQYVYLARKTVKRTESKVITRLIHYVAKSVNGQSLKANQAQQVTLTGTYYVDSKNNRVHASELKDAQGNVRKDNNGHIIYIVTNGTPQETWSIKNDPANHDVTVNTEDNQKFDFAEAKGSEAPATITAEDGGVWYYVGQQDNRSYTFDPAKSNEQRVTLTPIYLIYKQKAQYGIHYIDVNAVKGKNTYEPTDGQELTDHQISNIGEQGYVGDTPNVSSQLWNYGQAGYVLVSVSANAQNDQLGKQTLINGIQDQYVYLVHKAIEHDEAKTATRTIHYVANDQAGKHLQDDTVQTVTLNGVYYTDEVTGGQVHAKKFNDTLIVDSSRNEPAVETWTVDSATTGDLTTDNKSFKAVAGPTTITLNDKEAKDRQVNSGDWYLTNPDSIDPVSFGDPSSISWTTNKPNELPAGYLIYKQKAQYNIHYIDVNGIDKGTYEPTDGQNLTDHQISNIGDHDYVGDTPDASGQLWDYGKAGYVLVNVSDNAKNGQLGKQTLTTGVQDQYVYLKHGLETKTTSKKVNETIHYVYQDGSKAHDDYVAAPLSFTHTVVLDKVTGKTIKDTWTGTQSFAEVDSPQMAGYTPDQTRINSKSVDHSSKDLEFTVTYVPLTYTVTVHYVDEDGNMIKDPVVVGTGYIDGVTYTTAKQKLAVITKNEQTYNYDRVAPGNSETGVINGHNVDITYIYRLEKVQPSDQPTQPSGQPTQPSGEPTQPSDQPTQPSGEPTQPSDQPTQPSGQPTQPSGEPIQLGDQSTQVNGQIQLLNQSSAQPTQLITYKPGEPSVPSKPLAATQQKKLPQTGNSKLSIIEAGVLGMVNALAGFILGKKRHYE